jgi:class 3 adenylate cyclase
MNEEQTTRKLAAIFIADVAGYSRMMGEDELATVNTLSAYREVMINLIRQHRGRIVDTAGDNVLAEFPSVVDAMQSAVSIQKELKVHNEELLEHRRMQFRIGINIGDVIQEGDRIYGDGVNIAARLEALADPGGICISRMAYDQIESKLPLGYEYLGEQIVKNISKPLHAYRVILDEGIKTHRKVEPERPEFKRSDKDARRRDREARRRDRHAGRSYDGDHFEQSFYRVKDHLKDFAKDIRGDEELASAYKELKGRFRSFADDMSGSKERRKAALRPLLESKQLRIFLGIAFFLFLLNALTSFGDWWFLYPVVSVGLVIYLHWLKSSFFPSTQMGAMQERLFQKTLARLNEKSRNTEEGLDWAKYQAAARVRFYKHLYVYVGVNAFLIFINILSSPFNWWFPFPLLGWGLILFLHWMKLK